ncbi:MAG: hypothetical protein V4598_05655 [Bdellovibrionota bacterium]
MKIFILALLVTTQFSFAKTDCSSKAISAARKTFLTHFQKKDFAKALATLKPLTSDCYPKEDDDAEPYCWLKSDYSLALLKSGDPYECRNYLGGDMDPRSSCYEHKGISTNFAMCEKEITTIEAKYSTSKCNLKSPDRTLVSTKLPGKDDRCLALVGTKYGSDYNLSELSETDRDEAEEGAACPSLVILEKKNGKEISTPVKSDKDPAFDSMTCCYLDILKIKEKGAAIELLISSKSGPSQPCGGSGTARAYGGGIYDLINGHLKLVKDLSWATH